MESSFLLDIYNNSPWVKTSFDRLKLNKTVNLSGLNGSLDAVVVSGIFNLLKTENILCILHDREEAAYFQHDLLAINDKKNILFFPISYKRAYQFVEIDNANIIDRADVLTKIQENDQHYIIVTYPEALVEKVINKKTLVQNTFVISELEEVNMLFLNEFLLEYGFTKVDFVYEAGQFSVRGGILDIFSFSNEWPYRIELAGDEVESIREFNPETQLSIARKKRISIVPDVQNNQMMEERISFLDYLPDSSLVMIKDENAAFEVVEKTYSKIETEFDVIKSNSGNPNLVTSPEQLFCNEIIIRDRINIFKKVIISNTSNKGVDQLSIYSSPQPVFARKLDLLKAEIENLKSKEYTVFLASDSPKQLLKINEALIALDPTIEYKTLNHAVRAGFIDHEEKIAVFTDHQLFERYYKFKSKEKSSSSKTITVNEIKQLNPGDYVTHIDHGIGRFAGMEIKEVNGVKHELIRIIYKDNDLLMLNVHSLHKISKYGSRDAEPPQLNKLGSPEWENKKKKVKKRVKELAFDLISLYAKRKSGNGFPFSPDTYMQTELETSFFYEDTPDQASSTEDVKKDMESPHPMDRLICGDVGFGKTEVAIRSAFKAVADSKQVAVLVPTTILAYQHYTTFADRLKNFPVRVDYLNRFRTAKETKQVLEDLKVGKIDILIGTHTIVGKNVVFKDLGLLIIDEEQKFGVAVKEKLKNFKINVDVLTLTATPIPRTLQFSLMGARDLSVIKTPPPNRQPVTTEVHSFNEELIRDAVHYEIKRGGQVYFVHNRINDIEQIANIILRLVPDARVTFAHGQMDGKKLEQTMLKFVEHEYDVLVSTNIIESGLDIPNANTIIINQAYMFGLSDLHQMRGRVGRSNKKAFCYLIVPSMASLTADSRKRLSILEQFSDLGDGFNIALKDLDIRGAGDILGAEQSGFINDLGMETYQQIMEEAVQELKETEFKALFEPNIDVSKLKVDCTIETENNLLIPDEYVSNISERLRLYNQLDSLKNETELSDFLFSLKDRFGPIPENVLSLSETVKIRWQAEKLGFEKLSITNSEMKGYVSVQHNDKYFQSERFTKILQYVQKYPKKAKIKESKGKMLIIFNDINTVDVGKKVLESIIQIEMQTA